MKGRTKLAGSETLEARVPIHNDPDATARRQKNRLRTNGMLPPKPECQCQCRNGGQGGKKVHRYEHGGHHLYSSCIFSRYTISTSLEGSEKASGNDGVNTGSSWNRLLNDFPEFTIWFNFLYVRN